MRREQNKKWRKKRKKRNKQRPMLADEGKLEARAPPPPPAPTNPEIRACCLALSDRKELGADIIPKLPMDQNVNRIHPKLNRNYFHRVGYAILPHLLPHAHIAAMRKDVRRLLPSREQREISGNITSVKIFAKNDAKVTPATSRFLVYPKTVCFPHEVRKSTSAHSFWTWITKQINC